MKIKRDGMASEYITEALLILLNKKNYHDISITEICERAGVTRMSFYRNFESKEDILKKWVTEITDEFVETTGISYKNDSTEKYFTKLFTHMKEHENVCKALDKANMMYLIENEFDRVFVSVYQGDYDDYKSYFLAGGIYNVFLLWMKNGYRESPAQLAKKLKNILEK